MFKKLIPIVFLYGCGSEATHVANFISFESYLSSNVPSVVRPHFAEFFEHCKNSSEENKQKCIENLKYLSSIELKVGELDTSQPNVIGLCEIGIERKVTLRYDGFNVNSLMFKALIWHELGHCLLDLDHTAENSPSHIMNTHLPNERELGKNWASYTEGLFNFDNRFHLADSTIFDSKE
jgi:hypothetical protein